MGIEFEITIMTEVEYQNRYTHSNGIHYGNCILNGDSIISPVGMCVPVLNLEDLL